MDAYFSERDDLTYLNKSPILVVGSSEMALANAARLIETSGLRVADRVSIETARERIERQVSASAIWVELDRDAGPAADELLTHLSRDVADGRYAAIVSATAELIDPMTSLLADSSVELIIDADETDRAAALALAGVKKDFPARLSDVAADRDAARLRQLSEEVSRIASTLARLSTGPAAAPPVPAQASNEDLPPLSVETVRSVIRARRLRSRYFAEHLFADPAWDMLLDLLQAEIAQLRVPVSSLCIAAAVPATTALRWLKTMVQEGLFIRRADPHDGRRVFVELAPQTSEALRRYFAEVGKVAVI
ncbi:MAG TPA: MarR family winged helix-turn-helix transcriptional regulator [Sphingomicrobium sp.]